MQLWESTFIALRALLANKLRTILTMLGIIIGVGAVIGLISIGNGFREQLNQSFSSLGTNVIWIQSGSINIFGPSEESSRSVGAQKPPQPLTVEDAAAIADPLAVSNVVAVAPEYSVGPASIIRGQQELNSNVTGAVPQHETVRNFSPELGQFITQDHINRRARVAVLGAAVTKELFEPYEYPLGETIKIRGIPFEVIGVLEEKGQTGFGNTDNIVLIPLSTAQTRVDNVNAHRGSPVVSVIYLQAASQQKMDAISEQIKDVMRQRHRLSAEEDDDFTITTQAQLLEFGNTITAGLTAFLGSIAGVSLLVGGIGIMNIMLVSVTERTREIGIRKAVGAKRRDILFQFLVEAVVLSLIGGFIGIGLGYGVSILLPKLVPSLSGTVVTLDSILLATGFAVLIGLFFGVYPATRASRLKPIEALRYE